MRLSLVWFSADFLMDLVLSLNFDPKYLQFCCYVPKAITSCNRSVNIKIMPQSSCHLLVPSRVLNG